MVQFTYTSSLPLILRDASRNNTIVECFIECSARPIYEV